jgi:hypothetical protein
MQGIVSRTQSAAGNQIMIIPLYVRMHALLTTGNKHSDNCRDARDCVSDTVSSWQSNHDHSSVRQDACITDNS